MRANTYHCLPIYFGSCGVADSISIIIYFILASHKIFIVYLVIEYISQIKTQLFSKIMYEKY